MFLEENKASREEDFLVTTSFEFEYPLLSSRYLKIARSCFVMATKRKTCSNKTRQKSSPPKSSKEPRTSSPNDGVAKNAARERTRVKELRDGFLKLQSLIPNNPSGTKLSKLDILVLSTLYIKHLSSLLGIDCGEKAGQDGSLLQQHFINLTEEQRETMENIDDSGIGVTDISSCDPKDKSNLHYPLTPSEQEEEQKIVSSKRASLRRTRKKKDIRKTKERMCKETRNKVITGSPGTTTSSFSSKYLHPVKVSYSEVRKRRWWWRRKAGRRK